MGVETLLFRVDEGRSFLFLSFNELYLAFKVIDLYLI